MQFQVICNKQDKSYIQVRPTFRTTFGTKCNLFKTKWLSYRTNWTTEASTRKNHHEVVELLQNTSCSFDGKSVMVCAIDLYTTYI